VEAAPHYYVLWLCAAAEPGLERVTFVSYLFAGQRGGGVMDVGGGGMGGEGGGVLLGGEAAPSYMHCGCVQRRSRDFPG
jgi:hypothetical protein